MKMKQRRKTEVVEVTDCIEHDLRMLGCSRVWFSKRLWERHVVVPEWVTGENEATRVWDIVIQNPYLRFRPYSPRSGRFVNRYYVESYPNDPRAKDNDGTPIPAGLWLDSILTSNADGSPPRLVVLLVAELFPARVEGEVLLK